RQSPLQHYGKRTAGALFASRRCAGSDSHAGPIHWQITWIRLCNDEFGGGSAECYLEIQRPNHGWPADDGERGASARAAGARWWRRRRGTLRRGGGTGGAGTGAGVRVDREEEAATSQPGRCLRKDAKKAAVSGDLRSPPI